MKSNEVYRANKNLSLGKAINTYCKTIDPKAKPSVDILAQIVSLYKTRTKIYEIKSASVQPIREQVSHILSTELESINDSIVPGNAIAINEGYIKPIYDTISGYFPPNQRRDLLNLLHGKSINNKIVFQEDCNKLCAVFWYLLQFQDKIISNNKKETAEWICKYFQFIKAKTIRECSLSNVLKNLHSQTMLCAHPIPQMEKITK